MFANSKKTILKILSLYIGTSAIFLCIGFYYLVSERIDNIIFMQMANLRDISFEIQHILRKNNGDMNKAIVEIKTSIKVPFAIYNREDRLLFSNLSQNLDKEALQGISNKNGKVLVNPDMVFHKGKGKGFRPMPYKIILEDESLDNEIFYVKLEFGVYFVLILTLMGLVASILVKLFLKPLSAYIHALDTFIKDTTHEINTPLSVILMSIETLKKDSFEPIEQKKLERIRLASLQLSQIYSDLVAHNFPHSLQNIEMELSLDAILKERIDFFMPFFLQKNIQVESRIDEVKFQGSKEKITLVFDNLLSNAIKYNIKGGSIKISLQQGKFAISNTGRGIESKNLHRIFERYTRFSADNGGFGIGLFLVKKICDEYHIHIKAESNAQGTTFSLVWA